MKVSIIIPAHNEENRLSYTIESYGSYFKNLKKIRILDFEILIVLSACNDNTLGIVKKTLKKYPEISYFESKKKGKGLAVRLGFLEALKRKNDLIGFVDADLSTLPEDFYNLIKNINKYDSIIASRWKFGARVKNQTKIGVVKSKIFNFLTRVLFLLPYKDIQCGAKLFQKEALKKVIKELEVNGWAFDVELLYNLRKKGLKIKEYATVWENKKGSKHDLVKVSIEMILSIIRLRLVNSIFKDFVRFYQENAKMHKIQS